MYSEFSIMHVYYAKSHARLPLPKSWMKQHNWFEFAAFEQEVETKSFINPTQLSTVLTKQ